MAVVTSIFEVLGTIITQLVSLIGDLFEGVVTIFYKAGESGAAGELTFVGVLALVGVGVGLFWLGFGFIRNLIKMKG